jgi:ankyrin repeat protein
MYISSFHLQIASENGHTDVVQLLLDYNAQINKYNKDGESPLILATKHGYDGIVRLLLSVFISPFTAGI